MVRRDLHTVQLLLESKGVNAKQALEDLDAILNHPVALALGHRGVDG